MHEWLTPLCVPKPLQVKTQAVQRFAALGAHASTLCFQHISNRPPKALEATVLLKYNQYALTWPSLYETTGSSTHILLQFNGEDCWTSSWTRSFPALVPLLPQLLPYSMSSTSNPAVVMFCLSLKREAQHKQTRKCHRVIETQLWEWLLQKKHVLDTDSLHKPWLYGS